MRFMTAFLLLMSSGCTVQLDDLGRVGEACNLEDKRCFDEYHCILSVCVDPDNPRLGNSEDSGLPNEDQILRGDGWVAGHSPGDEMDSGVVNTPNDPEEDVDLRCDQRNTHLPCLYNGPAGTEGIGVCQSGQSYCNNEGLLSECVGEHLPTEEVCNGVDDDCDGVVDETLYTLAANNEVPTCTGTDQCGSPGVCQLFEDPQFNYCHVDPEEIVQPAIGELCDNGVDDDCDGATDEEPCEHNNE